MSQALKFSYLQTQRQERVWIYLVVDDIVMASINYASHICILYVHIFIHIFMHMSIFFPKIFQCWQIQNQKTVLNLHCYKKQEVNSPGCSLSKSQTTQKQINKSIYLLNAPPKCPSKSTSGHGFCLFCPHLSVTV